MRTRLSVIPSACLRSSGTDKCVIAAGALASIRHLKGSDLERARHQERVRALKGRLTAAGLPLFQTPPTSNHRKTAGRVRSAFQLRVEPTPTTDHAPLTVAPYDSAQYSRTTIVDGTPVPYLLDLATGASRPLGVSVDQPGEDAVVWSPDSRWLFTTATTGMITAVDPATAVPSEVGVALTSPFQLAVRPG